MPNRLASERSAYLRSAAHQPVDWHPWGKEAFDRAKREGKPLLLDIGAVWCHWCHVIDRESYDNPEIARLINEHFVAVKVDRDERPDVDARYQMAIQALSGQGGWPLTAFLSHEGKVFFGGTYFPPEDKWGRAGFRTVLNAIAERWRDTREDLLAHGEHLAQELERQADRAAPGELAPQDVDRALEAMLRQFDAVNGGFGTAPKFPHPTGLELALARYARTSEEGLRTILAGTLDGMARGGVMDQLGGGFHRYSVDAEWVVPHFEKMAYDNAGLLRNYSQAWAVLRQPLHKVAAEGIVAWLKDTMTDTRGGFFASQDADVGLDDDGDYWTWTLDELRTAVPDADLQKLLAQHFDIGERGEMHHNPRKNVLFIAKDASRLARELGLPPEMVEQRLALGRKQMVAARVKRPAPIVDESLFVSWNGMMVSACLEAWKALGDPWCRDFALRTLDRLLKEGFSSARGMAHVLRDGGAEIHGLLEDQVWMAQALLDAFECSGEPRYLQHAEELLRFTLAHFEDTQQGGLLDTTPGLHDSGGVAVLATKRKPIEDAPSASPNSVAILALDKLAALTGKDEYREAAERTLRAFAGGAGRMGLFASAYFLALEKHVQPAIHVVIVGPPGDAATRALHEAALRSFHPLAVVVPPSRGGFVPDAAREAVVSGIGKEGAVALVCQGQSCSPPARSPEELARLLRPGEREQKGPAPRWGNS